VSFETAFLAKKGLQVKKGQLDDGKAVYMGKGGEAPL